MLRISVTGRAEYHLHRGLDKEPEIIGNHMSKMLTKFKIKEIVCGTVAQLCVQYDMEREEKKVLDM